MVSTLSPNLSAEPTLSTFARRSLLPLRHDSLCRLLKTGVVRTLTLLEDGNSVTLGLWGTGDVVGILSKAEPLQIECLTPVEATLLPSHSWHKATEAINFTYSAFWRVN